MLTGRGWWFLAFLLVALGIALGGIPLILGEMPRGLAPVIPTLAIICLSLLAWFLYTWLAFVVKFRLVQSRIRIERVILDEGGPQRVLWARRPVTVEVTVSTDSSLALQHVSVTDRVPVLAQRTGGDIYIEGPLGRGRHLTLSYAITCPAAGRLRFDGIRVLATDLQGFFFARIFLRATHVVRVLPALADARGHVPTVKRHNLIPLMGAHPHRRPGAGSDLLDLRDYLPGDPPKMIAWKASARRGRLMSKELESEVPIRSTLFIDASNSTRIGPVGRNALARLLEIASAVVQASARARDLTGLTLFDEARVLRCVRPGRGPRHVLRQMRALADAGDLFPQTPNAPLSRLIAYAYAVLQDIYPDYLERDLNYFPIWLPLWSPPLLPAPSLPAPPQKKGRRWSAPLRWLWRVLRRQMARFSAAGHWLYRVRKHVAAVLSVHYRLDPGGLAMLLEDDELCRHYCERFLVEHQTPVPQPLYDRAGRYVFSSPGKSALLAASLRTSVRRGQDNELFVLLVDLFETSGPELDPLVRTVRVACTRHHQVIVVCPWPAGVPLSEKARMGRSAAAPPHEEADAVTLQEVLARASTQRVHAAFARIRQTFARLGVTVLAAPEEEAVQLILRRMHRLRVLQRGVR